MGLGDYALLHFAISFQTRMQRHDCTLSTCPSEATMHHGSNVAKLSVHCIQSYTFYFLSLCNRQFNPQHMCIQRHAGHHDANHTVPPTRHVRVTVHQMKRNWHRHCASFQHCKFAFGHPTTAVAANVSLTSG